MGVIPFRERKEWREVTESSEVMTNVFFGPCVGDTVILENALLLYY